MTHQDVSDPPNANLRVVLFTNIAGGIVYTLTASVLEPLGHRIVGVVTTPGPPSRRNADYLDVVAAVPPSIDVIVTSHPSRLAAMLAPLRPDLIITGGFPWLIPAEVIELPRLGTINMHPAPLPKYRGPHAVEWAFRNGDSEFGFTVHRMSGDFDTGPILAQGFMPLSDHDTVESLMQSIGGLMPGLLAAAMERVARGERGEDQDERLAIYAGPFEPEWRAIDWNQPARTVHNQIRSWTGIRGMPGGAIGKIDSKLLTIYRSQLVDSAHGATSHPAGTVLHRDAERIRMQCGDGPLDLLTWEEAGPSA
ncbi:MAG: methionyl-tRNA formyltransferase [Chloroflexota bacterium]|nr:methionyl-tRNA formyltransferase [Chloroflexota bacterium]